MAKGAPRDHMLRILILLSLTEGGLKEAQFKLFKKIFIESYGINELHSFLNAEDLGLYWKKGKRFDWGKIKKQFELINPEVRVVNPNDISYTYNGYSPLSVKFIESALMN